MCVYFNYRVYPAVDFQNLPRPETNVEMNEIISANMSQLSSVLVTRFPFQDIKLIETETATATAAAEAEKIPATEALVEKSSPLRCPYVEAEAPDPFVFYNNVLLPSHLRV